MQNDQFDICIIGSGPGGYVSAIRAAQLGLKVALIEKEHVGGVCLNWGCIPTKALLHCAHVYRESSHSEQFGISCKATFDIKKIVEHSRNTVNTLTSGVSMLLKKNKITLITGEASFIDKNTISIKSKDKTEQLKSQYFVIATGASARKLPNTDFEEETICTYKGAMVPTSMPKELIIIGGGVIGIEFASFYCAFGVKVTILEGLGRILTTEDEEVASKMHKILEKQGITIKTNIKVESVTKNKNIATVKYTQDNKAHEIKADKAIISIGVVPNTDKINLEALKVAINPNKSIKVNNICETNIQNIYAIGDVASAPLLAHKASHEGIIAAESIAYKLKKYCKKPHGINAKNIPACIYSYPQIASVGLTEEAAKSEKKNIKIGKFTAIGNGKSIATNDSEGFIKIILDKETDEILGAHIIGNNAAELIQGYTIAKTGELVGTDIINTIFPHPTVSEMMQEAVMDANGSALHK